MALKQISQPAEPAVTLAQIKAHLRISGADEDELLTLYAAAAVKACEHELGRALVQQTWELAIDAFPEAEIELPMPRVLSVVSVDYFDTTGTQQTLPSNRYSLDADKLPGWLFPADGTEWPETYDMANAVRIRFLAGYGATASSVPINVVQWLLMRIGTAYKMRETVAGGSLAEVPGRFVDGLLDSERVYCR